MRTILSFGLVVAIILALSTTLVSQRSYGQPSHGPQLRLQRGTFDARSTTQVAPTVALAGSAPGPYAIIQLRGPISSADREALESTGLELLEYLPDYAYLVRGTDTQLRVAARLPQTYARTSFTLADKMAPSLLRAVERGDGYYGPVRAIGWPDDNGALSRDLAMMGLAQPIGADEPLLLTLAGLESVRWLEPVTQPRILNDQARTIMNVDSVRQNRPLFGAGQVIAVADSGLDTGDLGTLSPDFVGRIEATHVLSAGGHWDDNNGHGTHVAGSIAGAGVQSGADPIAHDYINSFAGIAPEARLVIQAFEATASGEIIGLDPDYHLLFSQAYDDGARLHSDSWGDYTGPLTDTEAAFGGYPYGSQRTDEFLWEHLDMAIFVASGNEATDGVTPSVLPGVCLDADGVVDLDSLLSPGTAKNVISVGAGESIRSTGGYAGLPWLLFGMLHPSGRVCFSAEPIATDVPSNNSSGMAAFSSRGPTDDGRFKPDIAAPGTNIISNRSHHSSATALWGEYNDNYVYSGGTSMATPLVAGSGALVREWLISRGLASPSGAAIKAVLLNTTYDTAPGQYPLAYQEIPYARPNSVSGWGRADLGFMVAPPPYLLWVDDYTLGLDGNEAVTYTHSILRPLTVLTDTQPLRVMLAWTDYPASLTAGAQLVNDLDLVVTGPLGTVYYGNGVVGGDRTNNVEGVIINNPSAGAYQITVLGMNVPVDPQPYALAVGGPLGFEASLGAVKTASTSSADIGQTITYTYRVTNTGGITLTNVTGTDDKLGQVTFSPTLLYPHQSTTGMLTYTVQVSDYPGPLANTLDVTATTAVGDPITVTATAMTVVAVANPVAITATKTADVDTAELGQTITYTYRLTNTGRVTLANVSGRDDKLGPVAFNPSLLGPNKSATGTLTHTLGVSDLPGPLTNTVTASATYIVGEPITATATAMAAVQIVNPAAITVTKSADVDLAEVEQIITYTYRVTNSGTVTLSTVTGNDDKLGPVVFRRDALAPQQSATGTLTYTVAVADWPGPIDNTVEVSGTAWVGEPLTATAKTTATVHLTGPVALAVEKTANAVIAELGQMITYTYRVTNSGSVTLTGLSTRDDKLGPVSLAMSTLAPDAVTTAMITHTVQLADFPSPLTNTVTVSGTASVGPPLIARATDWASVQLPAGVDIYLPVIVKFRP